LQVIAALLTSTLVLLAADPAEFADHAAGMRLLSTKGMDVNATGADGSTALMYAAANNDLELVRGLIKAGANVKLKNQLGTSAITEAAIIGSARSLKRCSRPAPIPISGLRMAKLR